jgi:sugar phosphate isomerase/epimerase
MRKFKYAVSNWIYGDEDLELTYRRLQRAGFDGIELVGEPDRDDPERVLALNRQYGLKVSSVLSWCLWPIASRDLAHPDRELRRQAVEYIARNVDLAVTVGAPIVVVIPGPAGRPAPHGAGEDAHAWQRLAQEEWHRAVDSVRAAADYARDRGVLIAVEPINRFESYLVNSATQGVAFIQEVGRDNVKLHLDTFHMHIEDPDIGEAIRLAGPLLVNMHLSDSNRQAIGRGHFDFRGLLRALSAIDYPGYLVLEPLPAHPNPFVANRLQEHRDRWDNDAADSIAFLNGLESGFTRRPAG